jgi:hypothetical protein
MAHLARPGDRTYAGAAMLALSATEREGMVPMLVMVRHLAGSGTLRHATVRVVS